MANTPSIEPIQPPEGEPSLDEVRTRLEAIANLFQDSMDQLAYMLGLPTDVVLLDPDTREPLDKFQKKSHKDSAKSNLKAIKNAHKKVKEALDNIGVISYQESEQQIEHINSTLEEYLQVEEFIATSERITKSVNTPLPRIKAIIERKSGSDPIYIDSQKPVLNSREVTEVATGFPMVSSSRAMLNKELWKSDNPGGVAYARIESKFRKNNYVEHYISDPRSLELMPWEAAEQIIDKLGFNTAKLQFVLAAEAVKCDRPWEQRFILKGSDLIDTLGLGKRKDVTKSAQLLEIAKTAFTLSCMWANIKWKERRQKGKNEYEADMDVKGQMWQITIQTQSNRQLGLFDDSAPADSIDEVYLQVMPGIWTSSFLNLEGANRKDALYQYGYVSRDILSIDPYHDEMALRLAIYLVLNSRANTLGRYRVRTLLENVMPHSEIRKAEKDRNKRVTLSNKWLNALKLLGNLNWSVVYGDKYPDCMQPGYDGSKPRGYFDVWLGALVMIQPSWQAEIDSIKPDIKQESLPTRKKTKHLTADQIKRGRQAKGWNQAELAARMRTEIKQATVSYWERGKRIPGPEDVKTLIALLELEL